MSDKLLEMIPVLQLRHDDAEHQLADLERVANRLGMHKAADALRQIFKTGEVKSIRYGCHCELIDGMEPDGCVIDTGALSDCVYAAEGMRKEQCSYWRPC